MTDIAVLPVAPSAEGVARMYAELLRDAGDGLDLGSRRGQIACLSASVLRSLGSLRVSLGLVAAGLSADDPVLHRLQEAAANMTLPARAVVDCAAPCGPPRRNADPTPDPGAEGSDGTTRPRAEVPP